MAAGFITGGPLGVGLNQSYIGGGTLGGKQSPYVVTFNGQPLQANVLVYDDILRSILVANIFSNSDGEWELTNVTTERPFMVLYRKADGEIVGGANIFAV